jgi:hypothetical protein
MPYAILRFQKKKSGGLNACCSHNERKKEAYKSNPNIDVSRSHENYHIVLPTQSYLRESKQMIQSAGCKTRKDSTVMVETLITASPEFMQRLSKSAQKKYFETAFSFMESKIGNDNIISAVVHVDEKTPHMHLSFCPITKDKKLSAKEILGNQAQLSRWQTEYHNAMSAHWPELERGLSSIETKRKHIPLSLFKQAEKLDKQFNEVVVALSDINLINAKKKREEAISKLLKWLPEAERFTAQVKKVDGYIKSLESETRYQRKRNADLQQTLHEEKEGKIDVKLKHNKELSALAAQIRKQERLLQQIPPEIMEQYIESKNDRGRSR